MSLRSIAPYNTQLVEDLFGNDIDTKVEIKTNEGFVYDGYDLELEKV